MVKSIIRRILAGIGIMLAWYFIDTNFLMVVHAQDTNINPSQICAINNNGGSCNFSAVNSYQLYERIGYGNQFGASSFRGRIIWRFDNISSSLSDKYYDINFVLMLDSTTEFLDSNHIYFQNNDLNIYSCRADNTTYKNSQYSSNTGTAVVHCDNVLLTDNNGSSYNYIILTDTKTNQNGIIAISPITLTENVSSKQAKELEDINESIKDDSVDTNKADTDIGNMKNKVASNGSITQLLTLPITLYQSILNSASGSCAGAFDLGSMFGHHLELPCIQPQRYLGNAIWGMIDIMCCGAFILSFRKKMVDIFNHMTSLNDRGNELE